MPLIQPYEIFGLTSKATMDQVRRAYYDLALICHPDRGGSANDMTVINAAYEWIRRGLTGITSVEELANFSVEYDDLLAEYQSQHVPTFTELQGENFGLPRADFPHADDFLYKIVLMKWQNEHPSIREATYIKDYAKEYISDYGRPTSEKVYPASIPHGYSDLMTKTEDEPVNAFSKTTDIVAYVEPIGRLREQTQTGDVFAVPKLDNYTTETSTDYELAFTPQTYPDSNQRQTVAPIPTMEMLEALIAQRHAEDARLSAGAESTSLVWKPKEKIPKL